MWPVKAMKAKKTIQFDAMSETLILAHARQKNQ